MIPNQAATAKLTCTEMFLGSGVFTHIPTWEHGRDLVLLHPSRRIAPDVKGPEDHLTDLRLVLSKGLNIAV